MTIAAIRYNNPGNVSLPIQGWTGGGTVVGVQGQPGYASFPDVATGLAAFNQRVTNYIDVKGYSTIGEIGRHYATDPHWGAAVSNLSGIPINQPLDTSNQQQMSALQDGMLRQETGRGLADWNGGSVPAAPDLHAQDVAQDTTQDTTSWNDPNAWGQGPQTSGDFPSTTPDPNLPNATPGLGGLPHGDMGIGGSAPDPTQSVTSPPEAFNPETLTQPPSTPDKATQGQDTGSGAPVVITDITSAGTKAGGDIQKGLNTAGGDVVKAGSGLDTTINQATGSWIDTFKGIAQTFSNLVYDVIPRAGFGVLAVILVGIGFWFIGKEQRT